MKIIRTVNVLTPKQNNAYNFMKLVFLILQLLCSLDLGFFARKPSKLRSALKIYLLLQCVAYIVAIFMNTNMSEINLTSVWVIIYLMQYLLTVLILTFFKPDTTFCNLHADLREIDAMLQENSSDHIEIKIVMSILFCMMERMSIIVIICTLTDQCSEPIWFSYLLNMLYIAVDVALICYAFVFYSISCRFRKLMSILDTDDVEYAQCLYKIIIDTTEKYKSAFDPVYMVLLLLNVPQIMSIIFYTLKEMQNHPNQILIWDIVLQYLHVVVVLLLTIAPALTADMITTQAEKIKIKLHDKRLLQDVHQCSSTKRFIHYVEARPCRFYVWKVIPLSADLLGMVLNFCVTYLIVIVQFTNNNA